MLLYYPISYPQHSLKPFKISDTDHPYCSWHPPYYALSQSHQCFFSYSFPRRTHIYIEKNQVAARLRTRKIDINTGESERVYFTAWHTAAGDCIDSASALEPSAGVSTPRAEARWHCRRRGESLARENCRRDTAAPINEQDLFYSYLLNILRTFCHV